MSGKAHRFSDFSAYRLSVFFAYRLSFFFAKCIPKSGTDRQSDSQPFW
jgi:hypothetical protein